MCYTFKTTDDRTLGFSLILIVFLKAIFKKLKLLFSGGAF